MKKTLLLILILAITIGCVSAPKPVTFDADWEFKGDGKDKKACLSMEDVQRLREILITKCE